MTETVAHWQAQAAVKDRWSRPLRDLRVSVIDRCNYRCPYCMPAELYGEDHQFLPRAHWLTPGEIKRLVSLFLQLGVSKAGTNFKTVTRFCSIILKTRVGSKSTMELVAPLIKNGNTK